MSQLISYRFPFASYPALRLVLLLIAGICLAHVCGNHISLFHYLIFFAGLFTVWAAVEFAWYPQFKFWKSAISITICSLMAVCFGAALMSAEQHRAQKLLEKTAPLLHYEWETITIDGSILSRGKSTGGRHIYEIDVNKTHFPDELAWPQTYRIRVYGSDGESAIPESHNSVKADIRLYAFPEKRNPHEFDYGGWLRSKSIVSHGELELLHHSVPGSSFGWTSIRQNVRTTIDLLFDEKEATLAKALFIGYKKELTGETRQAFSRAGLSHIMAVSGMHVGFIVAPFWLLIPWLWRWKWGKLLGVLLLTLLLFGYAGLTGFQCFSKPRLHYGVASYIWEAVSKIAALGEPAGCSSYNLAVNPTV